MDLLLWPRDQETEFPVEACWLSSTQESQTEQIHPQTFQDPFFDSTGMIYMLWVPTEQTVNKEYYVEVLREFRKRFLGKRPALFKSSQWHFYQDNAPVHNSILVSDYLSKMDMKTVLHPPYGPDLAPCDFWLFPKPKEKEAVVMRQLRRWKRLWRRSLTCSYKRTSMEPSRSCWNGKQVHFSRRRLLRRELEFHECTINKSAHPKTVWKLIEGSLYLKIPERFACLILQDHFWVLHIPFVHTVKFQFLAQFSVNHLPHSLILFPR